MKKIHLLTAGVLAGLLLSGCGAKEQEPKETEAAVQTEAETETVAEAVAETEAETKAVTGTETETETVAEAVTETEAETEAETQADSEATEAVSEAQTESEMETEAAEGDAVVSSTALFGEFEALTLDGETVTQDIFAQADLTMVNIWGTFCGPCIREMPDLAELSDEYEGTGVQLVGIVSDTVDPKNETAHLIIEETKADYTHIVLSESLYYNYLMNVQVVPTTVFVDKEGNQVGDVYTGAKSKDDWAAIIEELRP